MSKNFGSVWKDLRCALAMFARNVSTVEIEVLKMREATPVLRLALHVA